MKVTVHLLAQLRKAAGTERMEIEMSADTTLAELLVELCRITPALRPFLLDAGDRPPPSILVFLGEEQVRRLEVQKLREGDVVTLLTPMAGG